MWGVFLGCAMWFEREQLTLFGRKGGLFWYGVSLLKLGNPFGEGQKGIKGTRLFFLGGGVTFFPDV